MIRVFKEITFAITFLTRIPLPWRYDFEEKLPASSMWFYPGVGLLLALILIGVDCAGSILFSWNITNLLVLITLVYLTGGLHLDGFIDTIDGFFSGRNRQRIMEIMHDSLIGSFGAISVFLLLLLKYQLLLDVEGSWRWPVLLLMPVISRWQMVLAAKLFPVVKESRLGVGVKRYLGWREMALASLLLVIVFLLINYFFLFPFHYILFIFISCTIFSLLICRYSLVKIKGLNGDIYGFINEIIEVIVLLSFAALS